MATELKFEKRPKLLFAVTDALLMIKRSSMHIIRNTDQLLGTFFQPLMFLVLFTAVYSGAVNTGSTSYSDYLMAGIIVQTIAFGSTTTAIAVANDLQKGIIDRFRALPMSNLAVMTGHVISDLFRNGISAVVLILVGLALGFRPNADFGEWMLVILLLGMLTLTLSWLSAILGIVAKSVEGVQWMTFIIIFPLTMASSAFVDPSKMTSWLRPFAENQPVTYIIDAVRGLLLGTPMKENAVGVAFLSCALVLIVVIPIAAYLFRRKTTA